MKFLSCIVTLLASQVTATDIEPENVLKCHHDGNGNYSHPFRYNYDNISRISFRVNSDISQVTYHENDSGLYQEIFQKCAFSKPYTFLRWGARVGYFECPTLNEFTQLPYSFQGTYFIEGGQLSMTGFSSDVDFEHVPLSIVAENTDDETKKLILTDYFPNDYLQAWYSELKGNSVVPVRALRLSKNELTAKLILEGCKLTLGQSFENVETSAKINVVQLTNFVNRDRFDLDEKKNTIVKYSNLRV